MRNGSIAVQKGETVATGQFVGYVGSSGLSSGPHLHWALYHNGHLVEPYQRAGELLADPLPYPGDSPSVVDIYTALSGVAADGRAERDLFTPDETPAVMLNTQGVVKGTNLDVIWYKPDGTEFIRWHTSDGALFLVLVYYLSPELGEWTIAAEVNGVRHAQTRFVRTASTQPEVKVTHLVNSFTQVLNQSTTPVLFDPVSPGWMESTRTFTVRNVGNLPLNTSDLQIPSGFSLVEGLTPTIDPGKEDTFTLAMQTSTAGVKSGTVSFHTNDTDESSFSFPIRGLVTDLTLSLSSNSVAENAASGELTGTVSRPPFLLSEPMTVYLDSNDRSEANVPLRVTIPAGERTVSFPVTAIDDAILDGDREVVLTASLIGNVSTTAEFTVQDHETLTLEVNRQTIGENDGIAAASLTVGAVRSVICSDH